MTHSPLRDNCPDCDVAVGHPHEPGCDVERCSVCHTQAIQCDEHEAEHDPLASAWTGLWPGVAECRALGWYAKLVPGRGWVGCDASDPAGREDLNRLAVTPRHEVERLLAKAGAA